MRGERVVGGSGVEMDSSEAGRGFVSRSPVSPSVILGFFGLRAFFGGVFGSGEERDTAAEPGRENVRSDH